MCKSDPHHADDDAGTARQPRRHRHHAGDRREATPTDGSWDPLEGAVPRRPVLKAGGALAVSALAGCLGGGDGAAPDPVALADQQDCDVCGMVIENHPGPNGQIYFTSNSPEGHDEPARFDSLKQCLFPYLFRHREMGWSEEAIYVTDYSSVEYTVQSSGDKLFVSSHPGADAFERAGELTYVVGSDVEGAMGPDFVPFAAEADAQEFVDEYGGEAISFSEIDAGVVGQ